MKRLQTVTALMTVMTFSAPAWAQQECKGTRSQIRGRPPVRGESQTRGQDRGRGLKTGGRRGQGGGGFFRLLDTDRDGTLSTEEIDAAVDVLLKLDTNRDGTLDAEELSIRGGGRPGRNRDGKQKPETSKTRSVDRDRGSAKNQTTENE